MSKKDKKNKKEKEKDRKMRIPQETIPRYVHEEDRRASVSPELTERSGAKEMDCLKLENQLCFPLYACAKEVVRKYRPLLDPFNLTYTQYIVLLVLWEEKQINVKTLGERLYLDSGTLTPLLKKLEGKGYVKRERALRDERNLNVTITEEGEQLKAKLTDVPGAMAACVCLEAKEAAELRRLLDKVLTGIG